MKRKIFYLMVLISVAFIFIIGGCASTMMTKVNTLEKPEDDYAMVTFLRPSSLAFAIKFGIWDSEKLVGILTANSYIQYKAEPGEHLFMGRSENWSYVKANLEAGKNYYIIGRLIPGVWKARVALDPVNTGENISQSRIDEWLKNLDPTTVIPEKIDSYVNPRLDQVKIAIEELESGKVKYMVLEADEGR